MKKWAHMAAAHVCPHITVCLYRPGVTHTFGSSVNCSNAVRTMDRSVSAAMPFSQMNDLLSLWLRLLVTAFLLPGMPAAGSGSFFACCSKFACQELDAARMSTPGWQLFHVHWSLQIDPYTPSLTVHMSKLLGLGEITWL